MRRRLYFILPNVSSARTMMNELLLSRVDSNHIHFLARPDKPLGDLPQASSIEKSDVVFCGEIGLLIGAGFGLLAGVLAVTFPQWFGSVSLAVIPYCMVIGALASAAWAGLLATSIPNHKLKAFRRQIEHGCVLMIVSVPFYRASEIHNLLAKSHPEAAYRGTWPSEHVLFP